MKPLSKNEVLALLRARAEKAGSQRALAERLGVTPAYLSDVLQGRREPGPKILAALGLRRVEMYLKAE